MKKICLLITILLISWVAQAATVDISWDPVTLDVQDNTENIGYYILYYGLDSRTGDVVHPSDVNFQYDSEVQVGVVTNAQRNDLLENQRYYFSVAAVDTVGNTSDYSTEVYIDIGDVPVDPTDPDDKFKGGCGCAGIGSGGNLWLVGLVLWLMRRHRWTITMVADKSD